MNTNYISGVYIIIGTVLFYVQEVRAASIFDTGKISRFNFSNSIGHFKATLDDPVLNFCIRKSIEYAGTSSDKQEMIKIRERFIEYPKSLLNKVEKEWVRKYKLYR